MLCASAWSVFFFFSADWGGKPNGTANSGAEVVGPDGVGATGAEVVGPNGVGATGAKVVGPNGVGVTGAEVVGPNSVGATGAKVVGPIGVGATGAEVVGPNGVGATGAEVVTVVVGTENRKGDICFTEIRQFKYMGMKFRSDRLDKILAINNFGPKI